MPLIVKTYVAQYYFVDKRDGSEGMMIIYASGEIMASAMMVDILIERPEIDLKKRVMSEYLAGAHWTAQHGTEDPSVEDLFHF